MHDLPEDFLADLRAKGIDLDLTLSILDDWNSGYYDDVRPVKASGVPEVDGRTVIATGPAVSLGVATDSAATLLQSFGIALPGGLPSQRGEIMF
ncbi:MAG: hypothetical protein ACOYM2_04465, partial [Rectinemataceae bacterium]